MKNLFITLTLLILMVQACSEKPENADQIFTNGKIYTVDSGFSVHEAMAIKNGRIVAVGTTPEISKQWNANKTTDLAGKFVYPGFIDPHCHFYGYGINLQTRCDLSGTQSINEIVERLTVFAENHPENQWIEGRGWDQNDWQTKKFPTKADLDKAFPDIPVVLIRVDGHASWVNSKALELAGITADSKIEGGEVILENGQPSGILIDNAELLVSKKIPPVSKEMVIGGLNAAQENCFAVGLTSVGDAGLDYETILLIDSLQKINALQMRIYAMLNPTPDNIENIVETGFFKTDYLNIRSIKMYADGALGSRGAKLLAPYSDAPNKTGLLVTETKRFREICKLAYNSNFQLNTHAIGDSAVRWVLHHYADFLKDKNDRRWRIEHSQIVAPEDFNLYGQFSIIPSIQTTHATSDMYWADERVGAERIKGAYAYKQLLAQNGWLPNGSDFPIESINPLYGFYAAVARTDHKGYPEGGFQPENALSRKEALRAMTLWAARAAFEENEKGSLETGKFADFVILQEDLMSVDLDKIPAIKVLSTYSNGKKVH